MDAFNTPTVQIGEIGGAHSAFCTYLADMKEFDHDPETYAIIGAAMAVHAELGPGFLEAVYQEALAIEFTLQGIPYRREVKLPVYYKSRMLSTTYRVDFLCFDRVLVELKAHKTLVSADEAQMINYLKAGQHDRGLLLNFGAQSLQQRRFVN